MTLSHSAKFKLRWWVDNTESVYNVIHHTQPEIQLASEELPIKKHYVVNLPGFLNKSLTLFL